MEKKKREEDWNLPYLLEFIHAPHEFSGNGMQLEEIQAVESTFQHVYNCRKLRSKNRGLVSSGLGPTEPQGGSFLLDVHAGGSTGIHQPGIERYPQKHICERKNLDRPQL